MLGYVIALMVAWPIVGCAAIGLSVAYWIIKGSWIVEFQPDKILDFANLMASFPENKTKAKFEWGEDGDIDLYNEDGSKFKEPTLTQRLSADIIWPKKVALIWRQGKAAYEHFKSEV